jgi:serine-type D-Ala-D-Ala carboxypeptidase/endopeptidase
MLAREGRHSFRVGGGGAIMAGIVRPSRGQIARLVQPYLKAQPSGLGFAIGYASPQFADYRDIQFFGNVKNQFGRQLTLGRKTPFEIASISKTFTATLYARLIRTSHPNGTLRDYISPKGPLPISKALARIKLDGLVNYTSGLPEDSVDKPVAVPPFQPEPYAMPGMLSYLKESPPSLSRPNKSYSYSNLAFAIMSAIIAAEDNVNIPVVHAFVRKMREYIFKPLGLSAKFFNEASLAELPLGFNYAYGSSPRYSHPGYWPQAPGHSLYPAYFGAHGIVATPDDMFKWLLFNMGIVAEAKLTPLLPALHKPSTSVTDGWHNQLGLGWFISSARGDQLASVFKDGALFSFGSYIGFVPSPNPGVVPSQAGAFALVNADGITDTQMPDGTPITTVLVNDLLQIMQGKTPPANKAIYPQSVRKIS